MITHFTAIAGKEIRTLMRSRRAFWFLLLALVIVGGAFVMFWFSNDGRTTVSERARFSRELFQLTSFTLFCALGLITPVMTATAFTSEREHKTLDLLASTTIPRLGMLLGKWLAAIVFQVALVLCLLPVLSLLFQLGGVGLDEYFLAAGLTVLAISTYGMLGLAFSVRLRRSMVAMLWTLGIILILNIGVLCIVALIDEYIHRVPESGPLGTLVSLFSAFYAFGSNILGHSTSRNALYQERLVLHVFFQLALFLVSAFVAWRGLVRGETLKPLLAKKLIDDPDVLARRRRRFPYYLVDPLRRQHVIKDGQNPVIVKEQRTGAAARLTTTIRLGYVGLVFSVPISVFAFEDKPAATVMNNLLLAALSFLVILVPILGATVISREREEGTLDLLTITPLSAGQIVRAKFRAVLRGLIILATCVLTLPILAQMIYGRDFSETATTWLAALPLALAFLAFYAALAVACSACCQRNMTAIVICFTLFAALYLSPIFMMIGRETLGIRDHSGYHTVDIFEFISYTACPFVSPITPLVNEYNPRWAELYMREMKTFGILLHTALIALMACGVLWLATLRMERRSDER